MDYEKKYKAALERAKEILECSKKLDSKEVRMVLSFFPELKEESENERIRKELISFVRDVLACHDKPNAERDERYESWIAWLEKQKEHSPLSKDEEYTLARIIEYLEENNCPSEWKDLLYDVYALPYQKEQKPVISDDALREGIAHFGITQYQIDNWLKKYVVVEKQGEHKSTDDIEPKFKIGDYVKNVNDKREPIYEIVYMDKECYTCEYRGKERMGDKAVMHFAFDNPYLCLVQKPAWSEEDEIRLKHILRLLDVKDDKKYLLMFGLNSLQDLEKDIDWLKSLKNRVGCEVNCTTTKEWSKEDERIYQSIMDDTVQENQLNDKQTNWLRDIKYRYFPQSQNTLKPSDEHYELEEFAKIVRCNLTGISKAVQKLFEAKYLQLTGNKMYGGFKD